MIIIFNGLRKSQVKIPKRYPITLSIENVEQLFGNQKVKVADRYITDEHRKAITLSAMERWKNVDLKEPLRN